MISEKIKAKLKDLPDSSGVYIMLSKDKQILYIGKAKVLKNRVKQYFQEGTSKTVKVMKLVEKIDDFNYIMTNNEIEALVLENNLIKKHKPPYNILLKDDKNYPFLRINLKEDFPRIEIVRKLKQDGAKYFGPYMQGISVKEITEILYSAFPVRECGLNFSKIPKNHRPCLNHHIGRCLAPCAGLCTNGEYRRVIDKVVSFLGGEDKEVEEILYKKMTSASEEEDFELALFYRDKLKILDKIVRKQITALPKNIDIDVFAIASNGFNTVVSLLIVRGGKLLGGHKEVILDVSSDEIALANYIMSYYDNSLFNAHEIVTAIDIEGADVIEEYLSEKSGRRVNVLSPKMGIRRQLADMAVNNAVDYLEKSIGLMERKENMTIGGMTQLQEFLKLPKMPIRMECFDISNISGRDKVSSMVVFTNGEPDRSQYRRFKIRTVEGANDFASMKETITRRFMRYKEGKDSSFSKLPDLVVIDGGPGQLTYTKQALEEVGMTDLNVIGLAERFEDIYLFDSNVPLRMDKNSYGLRLLQRLRDEAHRFAITFHRKLREKRQVASVLMEKIDGLGKSTFDALMDKFKSMENIEKATYDELIAIPRMRKSVAENIVKYFKDSDAAGGLSGELDE